MEYSIKRSMITNITALHLDVDSDKITDDSSFINDLGADSLDIVELIMALEEKFGSELPDALAEKMDTIGDVTSYFCTPDDQKPKWEPRREAQSKPAPKAPDEEFLIALRDRVFTVDFMRDLLATAKRLESKHNCQGSNGAFQWR